MRRKILQKFKLKGLILRPEALTELEKVLATQSDPEWVVGIVSAIVKKNLKQGNVVDKEAIQQALLRAMDQDQENVPVFQVFNSFDLPKIAANTTNSIALKEKVNFTLHGTGNSKALLLKERLELVHQRVLRNPKFGAPHSAEPYAAHQFVIHTVDSLMGSSGTKYLIGMLSQLEEDCWFLEDASNAVKLDLSQASCTTGLFTETCVVLVEGEMVDDVFVVYAMAFPPAETRAQTTEFLGRSDLLESGLTAEDKAYLAQEEQRNADALIVFLSDVFLDVELVMEKLRVLFTGYQDSDIVPVAFVLSGNFFSNASTPISQRKAYFTAFADLVARFPSFAENSHFVFVPGSTDTGPSKVLPRPPLPSAYAQALRSKLKHCTFTSNPCRLRYCTQEIALIRADIVQTLRANAVVEMSTSETTDLSKHLVRTLLHQAHMLPVPLHAQPLYWELDHTMRLHPAPDVLVLCEPYDQYLTECNGVVCFNPSPFSGDFSFASYFPSDKTVQLSQVP